MTKLQNYIIPLLILSFTSIYGQQTFFSKVVSDSTFTFENKILLNGSFYSFPVIETSSYLESTKSNPANYHGYSAYDFNTNTAWVPEYGKKDYIEYNYFVQEEYKGNIYIENIYLFNGYKKNIQLWKANSRIKSLNIYLNSSLYGNIQLEDTDFFQMTNIGKILIPNGKQTVFRFEIDDYYKGSKYSDIALTELWMNGEGFTSYIKWQEKRKEERNKKSELLKKYIMEFNNKKDEVSLKNYYNIIPNNKTVDIFYYIKLIQITGKNYEGLLKNIPSNEDEFNEFISITEIISTDTWDSWGDFCNDIYDAFVKENCINKDNYIELFLELNKFVDGDFAEDYDDLFLGMFIKKPKEIIETINKKQEYREYFIDLIKENIDENGKTDVTYKTVLQNKDLFLKDDLKYLQ